MANFWNKNKAAISGVLVAVIGLASFVGLGYYYSNSDVGYDYVGVGAQVDSLNYNTGNGNNYRIVTLLNEGLITPTVDYRTLQSEVAIALTEGDADGTEAFQNSVTDNDLTSVEEYKLASEYVLNKYAQDYLGDREYFEEFNENEKTLIILASSGEENLEYAARILTHGRPITYIGDDEGESYDIPEWKAIPESGNSYWQYAYGVSDVIYTDTSYSEYRFRMRDGSLDDGVATWQTWYDNGKERIDRVSAADVAFGISRQMTPIYGSAGKYMYTTISNLKGSAEITAEDKKYGMEDDGRFVTEEANTEASHAIYYALAPNSEIRKNAISEDESFAEFNPDKEQTSGIRFHDPKGFEDTGIESGALDYSYIDFSLNSGNKKFPTMMSSTGFWPVNWEWFSKEVWAGKAVDKSGVDAVNLFATSEDTTLSNGAQQVVHFDNLYGYTTEKNPNYFDTDLVTAEKTSYRMVTEASTQVAMFSNGDATYITGADSNTKVIIDDPDAEKWLKSKFTSPATKYMFFNLGTDRLSTSPEVIEHAKYTSDPNFRRAFTYAFNTDVYHELSSVNTAHAVSTFEPLGMYSAYDRDFVDHMTDTTFTTLGTEALPDTDPLSSGEQLEYYSVEDRQEVVENPIDFSTAVDPTQNFALADYYFEIFLDDMAQLGVTVPKEIHLKYLTSIGPNDPFIKAIQQEIETHVYPGGYTIKIDTEQVASGKFFESMYAADYDIASIQWGADYLDAWSNIGIFNSTDPERGLNSSAGWNFWDGSDNSFDDTVYGADKTELAQSLFNDGMKQFYESPDGANITSIEYQSSVDSKTYTSEQFKAVMDTLLSAAFTDNGITEADWLNGVGVADPLGSTPTFGINFYGHTEDIWSNPEVELAANIIFEVMLKDGGAIVVGKTESGSISPSRALLEGDPVIGYESRTFSFDLTKTKGFWRDVEKELKDEFYK